MAKQFVDRQPTYPNRYKWTNPDGSSGYFQLERADEPTVPGTPLNAETFNDILNELANKFSSDSPMVLTEGIHYGDDFPPNSVEGQFFLKKKVTE
jgi:hypothetical protein